jgi:ATP-dependent RNA helicase DHX57
VAENVKTTSVGQTQVAQWQRLPSQLLQEFCQKQKRPPPKFKELLGHNNKYKCRCIVPDAKDPDKDLILVPALPVGNEEQAKEEAALLALLHVTPNLPHERKLPEPYKTTWLTAVEAQKEAVKSNAGGANLKPSSTTNTTGGGGGGGDTSQGTGQQSSSSKATANANLALGISHVSAAARRRDQEERRKERNSRIRKHENIRMANRDHPVFLSAKLRQQIQRLLQGDTAINPEADEEDDDNAPELSQFSSDQQQYIEERLHIEGFTKRQGRKAFEQLSVSHRTDDETQWENTYEECLQWLCVHLPEDQLPEGFDPRGSTLEVVGTTTNSTKATAPEVQTLANRFGLLPSDATWLLARAKALNKPVETVFWDKIVELANVTYDGGDGSCNPSTLEDEKEALEAMFPEGLKAKTNGSVETIEVPTPDDLIMTIVLDKKSYPSLPPRLVLCSGSNWLKAGVGVAFHVELAKFLSTITRGEPMIFEIFNQVQMLQQNMEDLNEKSLTSARLDSVSAPNKSATPAAGSGNKAGNKPKATLRARQRGVFWSRHPSTTPPATAFPVLGPSLERQRKSLPAGKAREDFLTALREANRGSRVVLVTGATGSGKTTQIPQFILGEYRAWHGFRLSVNHSILCDDRLRWLDGNPFNSHYVNCTFRRGARNFQDCCRTASSFGSYWRCRSSSGRTWGEQAWSR